MMKIYTFPKIVIIGSLVLLILLAFSGCKSDSAKPAAPEESQTVQQPDRPGQETIGKATTAPDSSVPAGETDIASITSTWQSSPHANTFVLDDEGQNNSCARCHAPVNWSPTIADIPESCFACKFELKEPAPLVPENAWANISCNVCHKVDKKGNIQPEYAWLEIAALEQYAEVASPTELCLKCHAPVDIPNHGSVTVSGAHAGFECIQCHSTHSTAASCDAAGCHGDAAIPVHDTYHQAVTCAACHDGSGMEVGQDEEMGFWLTFQPSATGADGDHFAFTSHQLVREVDCSRCHFSGNPWGLLESVSQP